MANKILLTGVTGRLGAAMLQNPTLQQQELILASRKQGTKDSSHNWQYFDLSDSNCTLHLSEVSTIIHLASSTKKYSYALDVKGTARLLDQAKAARIKHFIYISIVGVDQVPVKYFKIKRQTEQLIEQSGLAYTILRATQFFGFFEKELLNYLKLPIGILPSDILYQPIEIQYVVQQLVDLALSDAQNKILELGGSETIRLGEAAKLWLAKKGKHKLLLSIPLALLGKLGRAMKNGALTSPSIEPKSVNWESWLNQNY